MSRLHAASLLAVVLLLSGCASSPSQVPVPAPVQTPAVEIPAGVQPSANPSPALGTSGEKSAASIGAPSPADLESNGELLLEDGAVRFYRLERGPGNPPAKASLWLVQNGKVEALLPEKEPATGVRAISLGSGQRAYLLQGSPVGAHVAGTRAYYLLQLSAEGQHLFQFETQINERAFSQPIGDALYSSGWPRLAGEHLESNQFDSAAGKRLLTLTWQLDLAKRSAKVIAQREVADGNK